MPTPCPIENGILAALSADEQASIFPHLHPVSLSVGQMLHEPDGIVDHVYFPTDAVIALLCTTEDGHSAEVAIIGYEGMAGVAAFSGGGQSSHHAVVQCPGSAFILSAKRLLAEFDKQGTFHRLALRYSQALMTQMAQTAVCNRCHSIEQQLCRWLLLSLDRTFSQALSMTQEQIAGMLGVRREGVAEAAGRLQRLGVIEYRRGHILVRSRAELERRSCECYGAVKREVERLMSIDGTP